MLGCSFSDTPIPYQDLASSTMPMMNLPLGPMYGAMYGGTMPQASLLGGVQMKPQLDNDKVQLMNKKDEEGKSTFKKAALGLGAIVALCAGSVLFKSVKKAGGIGKYIKNLFTQTPQKPSVWKRFKGWCSAKWTRVKGKPDKWNRFKGWCGNKWSAVKTKFKRNPKP